MINIIGNIILSSTLAVVNLIAGIVTSGLKMWLPFEKSEILGEDLTEGYDFTTSGWSDVDITEKTANTFKSNPDGGVYKTLVEVGKAYKLTIAGTTDASSGIRVGNANDNVEYYSTSSSGAFSDTVIFVPTQTNVYIKNKSAGDATITTLKIQEVTQIAPDKSGNSNNATLYTGKCLDFNGSTDYVNLGLQSNPATNMTFACWLNPVVSASTSYQTIIDYGRFNAWLNDNDTLVIYTNASGAAVNYTISDLNNKWSRLVVSVSGTTTSVYIDGTLIAAQTTTALSDSASQSDIGRDGTSRHYEGKLSDLQIYDVAWTQADVTFDYNNPQHLVTDNSASSIALSNLKGYWHLSEGNGNVAFNSGVPLGSELIPDGDFPLGTTEWSSSTGAGTFGDGYFQFINSRDAGVLLTSSNTGSVPAPTSIILFTYTIYDVAVGDTVVMRIKEPAGSVAISRPPQSGIRVESNGTYTFIYTGGGASNRPAFEVFDNSDDFKMTNVSAKVISVGKIVGASWETAERTIPQLGMMDWNKLSNLNYFLASPLTQNANIDVTLISNPNDPSKDITGNLVRLREHSLNLDGSGYAEVPDDASINPTSAITIQCWIKSNTENNKGLVAKYNTDSGKKDYALIKRSSHFRFYIGDTNLDSGTIATSGWVNLAATYDGSVIKTYINGDFSTSTSFSGAIPNNTNVLEIGRWSSRADLSYSEIISDVLLYDTALDADEIENNYNAGLSAHTPSSSFSDDFSSDYGF